MKTNDAEKLLVYALNERRATEDVWHELCTGAKAREEVVALRAGIDSKEDLAHKLALFAPMTDGVREKTLAVLLERYYSAPASATLGSSDELAASVDREVSVVAFRQSATDRKRGRQRWITAAVAVAMALAAAILLVWSLQRPSTDDGTKVLPEFLLELRDGGSGEMRDGPEELEPDARCGARYRAEQTLSFRLRPMQSLHEELAVAVWARRDGAAPDWLELPTPSQGDHGALTLRQPLAELDLGPGIWTLTFYITRKGHRPELKTLRELEPGAHPGVTVVEGILCIEQ